MTDDGEAAARQSPSSPAIGSPTPESETFQPDAQDLDEIGRSSIGRNAVHLLGSQVVTLGLAMVLSIVQPRFLGPEALGQLRLSYSIWLIAQVFIAFGTRHYLLLETARNRARGIASVRTVLILRMVIFGVATIVLIGGSLVLGADSSFLSILALYGVAFLLSTWLEPLGAIFAGLEQMRVPASAGVISRVFASSVAVIVLLGGGDARSVVAVTVVANLLELVIVARAFRRLPRGRPLPWRREIGRVVKSSRVFLLAAAALAVYQQIDVLVISAVADTSTVGWYATAANLCGTLLLPSIVVTQAVYPVLARLRHEDPGELEPLVQRTFSTLAVTSIPIGFGVAVVAGTVAPLLFGNEFRESAPVIAVLGPVNVLTSFNVLFAIVALATARQAIWNTALIVAAALTIPLDLIFVPWTVREFSNGAIGGAMSYVVTELIQVGVGLCVVCPFLLSRRVASATARVFAAGALMVAATFPLRDRFLAVPIIVGATVYIGSALLLGAIPEHERELARRVLARLRPAHQ